MTREELDAAASSVGQFGSDNRAGIPGTLHRISALRNRSGAVVGLTCRVGRAVSGHANMVRDILEGRVVAAGMVDIACVLGAHCNLRCLLLLQTCKSPTCCIDSKWP